MNTFEITLERDTANDQSAVVAAVLVPSGTAVVKDEPIFEIENSKATEEYLAPGAGILLHELAAGQTVDFGVTIARVVPAGSDVRNGSAASAPRVPAAIVAAALPHRRSEPRFSAAAATLLASHGLSAAQFDADFVTASDVVAHVACQGDVVQTMSQEVRGNVAAAAPAGKSGAVALQGLPVGQRKRAEIDTLVNGAGQTMLSVLGLSLGPLMVRRKPGDFLAGRITDLVLYEASRLMRKYPRLNAFYADGQMYLHESVHAGLAIDDGGRLMVYGFENADEIGLPELADSIADAVGRYVNGELTAQELTRATFTVTDLSAGDLDFVLPLLPRGQSCILGITSSGSRGYHLFAGFDHRITEGREVMTFLGELRERLLSFSCADRTVMPATLCSFCGRSSTEAVTSSKERGLLKIVGRDGEEVLCCSTCWDGW